MRCAEGADSVLQGKSSRVKAGAAFSGIRNNAIAAAGANCTDEGIAGRAFAGMVGCAPDVGVMASAALAKSQTSAERSQRAIRAEACGEDGEVLASITHALVGSSVPEVAADTHARSVGGYSSRALD